MPSPINKFTLFSSTLALSFAALIEPCAASPQTAVSDSTAEAVGSQEAPAADAPTSQDSEGSPVPASERSSRKRTRANTPKQDGQPASVADTPANSDAQSKPRKTRGTTLGVALGVAVPFGRVATDATPLNDAVPAIAFGSLELGYRLRHWWFGGAFLGGVGGLKEDGDLEGCGQSNVSCDATLLRLQAKARYYVRPGERIDPFIGLGTGYEWYGTNVKIDGDSVLEGSARGQLPLSLEAGAQLWSGKYTVNVFATYSVGAYTQRSVHIIDQDRFAESIPSAQRALHHWLSVNVGTTFMP